MNTIKHMVNRFLGWKLPKDFSPDAGINFHPSGAQKSGIHGWPTGTNLLTDPQATAMFEHCMQDLQTGWIKTSERLPEIEKTVFIVTSDNEYLMSCLYPYGNKVFWTGEDFEIELKYVMCWMEIPPLPEEQ